MSDMIRRHITFYGRVQRVGFRYTAEYAALNNNCTGWVKNEYDGSVLMEIQGREEDIDEVLAALENDLYIRITDMEAEEMEPLEDEYGFKTL